MATRMQQRRGTAAQWTAANPILSAGEIGFESDSGQFKIGDGTTAWTSLTYFKNFDDLDISGYVKDEEKAAANGVATLDGNAQVPISQLSNIIQSAPAELDTLAELAAGLTTAISDLNADIGNLETSTSTAIVDINTDITALTTNLATETSTREAYATSNDAALEDINTTLTTHAGNISDLSDSVAAIETLNGTQGSAIDTLNTTVSGIQSDIAGLTTDSVAEGTNNLYFTTERAQDALGNAVEGGTGITATYDDSTNKITVAIDGTVATELYADNAASGAISDHNADTTNVHGISDTAALATKTYADDAVGTHNSDTTSVHGIANTAELETQTGAQAKADNAQTAAEATAAATYAPKVAPAITGNATAENLTITGNLTVQGTTTTVDATNLEVTDSLIYLAAEQYDTDTLDIGIFGAYGDSNSGHFHTGIVRDATDGKWKLVSGAAEPTDSHVDFGTATFDTLKLGGVEFADGIQTKQGVPSITTISQKTASYTLSNLNERDTLIEVGSSSATTLTIPADSSVDYPIGTTLDILQTSSGQVTIAGAGGVTVNATPGLKLRTQWSSATLMKRAANTWVVYGDLSA
jgi:uncharacterized protein YoxC